MGFALCERLIAHARGGLGITGRSAPSLKFSARKPKGASWGEPGVDVDSPAELCRGDVRVPLRRSCGGVTPPEISHQPVHPVQLGGYPVLHVR